MSKETIGGAIFTQGIGTPMIPCRGGYVSNIGLDLTSGILKIVSADGTDCTAAAEGHISMPSITIGQQTYLKVIDALHFVEDANGTHDFGSGEFFGKTNAVAWAEDMPLYLYAINSDDTDSGLKFAFSPDPTRTNSPPTAARGGYHGTPTTGGDDKSFFYMTSTDVRTTHADKPCMLIGSFKGQFDASGIFTFAALTLQDGIGKYNETHNYKMPTGQMGAASGKFFWDNGGVAPGSFGTAYQSYQITPDGWVDGQLYFTGATAGSGAVQLYMATPYFAAVTGGTATTYTNNADHRRSPSVDKVDINVVIPTNFALAYFIDTDIDQFLLNQDLTSGSDGENLIGSYRFKAF